MLSKHVNTVLVGKFFYFRQWLQACWRTFIFEKLLIHHLSCDTNAWWECARLHYAW